ncbi:MAG TPA: twin-arginine translocase TatA/TatE family subunit [Bacteroidota bacterium]|nr:twin-arginine translocase TatA/TatE family subunit [Bacteroidota bacterium]
MGNLGAPELILILLVILIFFGAKKIPEIAQGFGKGVREFRKASKDIQEDIAADEAKVIEEKKNVCPYCSAPFVEGAKFCPSCGKSLSGVTCSKCHANNPVGSRFCKECGNQLTA